MLYCRYYCKYCGTPIPEEGYCPECELEGEDLGVDMETGDPLNDSTPNEQRQSGEES